MHAVIKRLTKWLVRFTCKFLPEEKAHQLERWRRGREEFWKYNHCDYIFASYGKSGRTWVRVMISRYYQLEYNLPDNILMGFDNYTRLNSRIPKSDTAMTTRACNQVCWISSRIGASEVVRRTTPTSTTSTRRRAAG